MPTTPFVPSGVLQMAVQPSNDPHTELAFLGLIHPYASVYDLVVEAATERGLLVTRTLSAFRFRFATDLWVGPVDLHPNRRGHAILARALADDILALPDRCFEREEQIQRWRVQQWRARNEGE